MQPLETLEIQHRLWQAATAPVGGVAEWFALAVVTAAFSGLVGYAGWLRSEGQGREAAGAAALARFRWWLAHGDESWDARLTRLEDSLSGESARGEGLPREL